MESILSVFTVMSIMICWLPLFLMMLEWPTLFYGRRVAAKVPVRRRPYGYTPGHYSKTEDRRLQSVA